MTGIGVNQLYQYKRRAAVLLLTVGLALATPCAVAFASSDTSSAAVSSRSDDSRVPEVTVSSNPQETLGTVGFSESNTKRISVGASTRLYLTIKDMGYNFSTTFSSSDPTIATVEMVDTRAVKVVGLKNGTITITATVDSATKGVKVARYTLVIGDETTPVPSQDTPVVSDNTGEGGGIITDDDNNIDLDLYSSTEDPMLIRYAESRSKTHATSLLLGLIAWIFIISGVVYIFSVVISLHTPKLNVSPGTRRRYSTGGSDSLRSGRRLLPDKYYRNLKKY